MLSEFQFIKLLNNILTLPICQSTGASIKQIGVSKQFGGYQALIHFGAGHKNSWLLYENDRTLVMRSTNFVGHAFRMSYDPTTLTIDKASAELLAKNIIPAQYTVGDIIATIVNTADRLESERSEAYNNVYLQVSQCLDSDGNWDIVVVVNRSKAVPFQDMMTDDNLSMPIDTVKNLVIDVLGRNPTMKQPIPFFHIVIADGTMSLYRYMLVGKHFSLSNAVDRFDLKNATKVDKMDDTQTTLHDMIMDAISKWSINHYDADSNGHVPTDTIAHDARFALGFKKTLQNRPSNVIYVPATSNVTSFENFTHAFALDEFYPCYPINDLQPSVYITKASKRNICITYTSKHTGVIAKLYIDVDMNHLVNKNSLDDPQNVFIVSPVTKPILAYNDGSGTLRVLPSFDTGSAVYKSIRLIRALVTIVAFITDIGKIADFCVGDARYSERSFMDMNEVQVVPHIEAYKDIAPKGTVIITSRSNDKELKFNCTLNLSRANPGFSYNFPGINEDKYIPYIAQNSVIDQCQDYISGGPNNTLGAWVMREVAKLLSVKLNINRQGLPIVGDDTQQERVINATRLQSNDEVCSKLLDVRDALIKTFGPGIIGTPNKPSKFSDHMNVATYMNAIKKHVRKDGKLIPVLAEFDVFGYDGIYGGGGSFMALREADGINVYCKFTDAWSKVTLRSDNQQLSDKFLKWYLLDCKNNQVTRALQLAIKHNADQKYITQKVLDPNTKEVTDSQKLVYKLSDRVKTLLAPTVTVDTYENNTNRDERLSLNGDGSKQLYIPKDVDPNKQYDPSNPNETLLDKYDAQQRLYDDDSDDSETIKYEKVAHYPGEATSTFDKWKDDDDSSDDDTQS